MFDRAEENSTEIRTVHRTLFHRMNQVPQKKVRPSYCWSSLNSCQSLTFSKFTDEFVFNVQYEPLSFLSESQIEFDLPCNWRPFHASSGS